MPKVTPKVGLTYQSQYENPWYGSFEQFVTGVDRYLFASVEDRNLILFGGGTVGWSGGVLSWSEDLHFWTPSTGALQTLAAGSVSLVAGQAAYVTLTRGAGRTVTLTLSTGTTITVGTGQTVLVFSYGEKAYLRTGQVLTDGEEVSLDTQTQRRDQSDQFTLDNTTWEFELTYTPHELSDTHVYMNGVLLSSGYALSGTTLTLDEYPVEVDVSDWVVTVSYQV